MFKICLKNCTCVCILSKTVFFCQISTLNPVTKTIGTHSSYISLSQQKNSCTVLTSLVEEELCTNTPWRSTSVKWCRIDIEGLVSETVIMWQRSILCSKTCNLVEIPVHWVAICSLAQTKAKKKWRDTSSKLIWKGFTKSSNMIGDSPLILSSTS